MPTGYGGNFWKNASTWRRFNCRRTNTWPAASTPCTWKTDLAMSKPIVVTVCMARSSEYWDGSFNSPHTRGTHVPMEEPSTADALTWHWPLVPLLDRSKVGPSSASRGPSQPYRHEGEGHGQRSARYVPSFSIYKQRLQLNCHHDNGCVHHCGYADIEAS